MDFDEHGVKRRGLDGEVGGVEAFYVADLQFDVRFPDELYELAGFVHGIGEGFLHEYVFTLTYGFFAQIKVEGGRGDDIDEVTGFDEAFGVQKSWDLIFIGDFLGDAVVGVVESYQFCYFYFFPVVEVKFSEVTDSKDADFKHLLIFIRPQTYTKKMEK